ncbi:hypothetical protein F7725_028458 [Dissostichus mawsoni]|uniref:Uncharacterized protein n=1 Tax=Dissostichus mawsoni TaxID=36200 RepID=A0A7J5XG17_DISMA|nr:hypothetical protein F7725_028458 [Dissostichus mawsoni]
MLMNLLAIPPCSPCSACKDTCAPSKGADVSDAGTISPDTNRDQHHCSRFLQSPVNRHCIHQLHQHKVE